MERKLTSPISLSRYGKFAYTAKTRLETFIESSWDIPTLANYDEWLNKKDTLRFYPFLGYSYLAYLRHHGFPSPLLDWTASHYIASFFAFNEYKKTENNDSVSIYCYLEQSGFGKIRSSDKPAIYSFGPYEKIHKRHIQQQSQYTICVELDNNYKPVYANHQSVFLNEDENQDQLWKFNIPIDQRNNVLKSLNKMNINSFTLFGTEDSLIESISSIEIIKNNL